MVDDSALLHGEEYDPQKAREYYLRTRKLKGRKAAQSKLKSDKPSSAPPVAAKRKPATKPISAKRRMAKQAETKAQVKALKARLEKLKGILAKLIAEAKARSGGDPNAPKDSKDTPRSESKGEATKTRSSGGSSTKDRKPLTAAQKAAQAKRSKEAYEKSKKEEPSSKEIEAVKEKIASVRKQLKAAIAEAAKNGDPDMKAAFADVESTLDSVFSELEKDS